MKPIAPWKQNTECPHSSFKPFRDTLLAASFHHAGPSDEWKMAKNHVMKAAEIAIEAEWPYWAMERMFREIGPLVAWDQFMQTYINILSMKVAA